MFRHGTTYRHPSVTSMGMNGARGPSERHGLSLGQYEPMLKSATGIAIARRWRFSWLCLKWKRSVACAA